MSKSLQSKSISRTITKNIDGILRIKENTCKRFEGNSQFIRSKFDNDYEPKLKIIKPNFSSNYQQTMLKKTEEHAHATQLQLLSLKAQQQIKLGKKLIIDWNKKDNFRSTRFPSLDQCSQKWKRITTEPIQLDASEKLTRRKISQPTTKIFQRVTHKQISCKSEHLRNLLNQNLNHSKMAYNRKKKKIHIDTTSLSMIVDSKNSSQILSTSQTQYKDPHFNYSIIQEVEEKNKQFFSTNKMKIKEAIRYEKYMSQPIEDDKFPSQRKNSLDFYKQRVVCKSKLTLLKSELAKKFKQIKEGFLDQTGMHKVC